ncbi:MAG: SUMF1/EgtB/PvdO family nonheme iron enzyme [Desulfobacterales bacterium]|nr:SUMF1/EgtB/PvdO family nonheme iron enzyme [Desulfobacterales bacterium]
MTPAPHAPVCPVCGEPIKVTWKFCPVCETPLGGQICPSCRQPVKDNWKRCPECGARLVCGSCGSRLAPDQDGCPACKAAGAAPAPGRPEALIIEPATEIALLFVPGGRFRMGDSFGDGIENETPVHEVQLDGFYIGRTPVTQAQWLRVMPENPSRFCGDERPVEQVTWEDVAAFIQKVTALNPGRRPVVLPSEAQWEFAARSGGREEKFAGGLAVDRVAWYEENSGGTTHPVGEKAANGLGLFDMSGNVWEWCRDSFQDEAYRLHVPQNPVCTGRDRGADRVIRGGSWNLDAWSARCARRSSCPTGFSGPAVGFRLAMIPDRTDST